MAKLDASKFLDHLQHVLNDDYELPNSANVLTLEESNPARRVDISYNDAALGFRHDFATSPKPPLFHFLDDHSMPWASRCDFIIFHAHENQFKIYLIEFKKGSIEQHKIKRQLDAGESWCQSLWATLSHYENKQRPATLCKYVFSDNIDISPFADKTGIYLQIDPNIRHYSYKDARKTKLEKFDRSKEIQIE